MPGVPRRKGQAIMTRSGKRMTKPPRDAAFFVLLRREVVRVLVDAGKEAGGWEDCCS